ncbi:hypothetical protein B1207_07270 [Legionella quinlivanii]|uniref:Siderophore biosynthetic enzyme FrgA n=1 Tax=Legionella quinlivanii TaxID=45073 RepID=A0A364LJA8_9GAMM|nr:IucA/IucC family protein [Legionella quinlivanii]RAP36598.1 hypothetical protein B1207_07270 [Legionella quinlivanii]
MALAYGDYHGLTHQLRFLLFEMGIACSHQQVETAISRAQSVCLQQLRQMAVSENLASDILSHEAHDFVVQLKESQLQKNPQSYFFQWPKLLAEVDHFIANKAMMLLYEQRWHKELSCEMGGSSSFWSWLLKTGNAQHLLLFLGQWAAPYDLLEPEQFIPDAFKRREVLQYAPQFNSRISLHWCALHRSQTITMEKEASLTYQREIQTCFPDEYKRWQDKLFVMQRNASDYLPVPVHPWQWRNLIQSRFSHLIDQNDLLLIPHHQQVKPLMSLSCMAPVKRDTAELQLPLSDHPASSYSNDRALQAVLAQVNQFEEGVFVTDCMSEEELFRKELHLLKPMLFQSPLDFLKTHQMAVPFYALLNRCPGSGSKLISEIVAGSSLSPIAFFEQYSEKFLTTFIRLLVEQGTILLFASADLLLILDNHIPKGIIFKRVQHQTIAETPEGSELIQQFISTIFLNHLQVLIKAFSHDYQLNPAVFWKIIKKKLLEILPGTTEAFPGLKLRVHTHLFSVNWLIKKRLSLNLLPAPVNECIYYSVPNPLLD